MQVLKHQKQEPIGIHALEVKVQLKHDERREFYDLLEQMQKAESFGAEEIRLC